MLFKLSSLFLCLYLAVTFYAINSQEYNSDNIVISESYLDEPAFFLPKSIKKEIKLKATEENNLYFHLNYCAVYDLKISLVENGDTTMNYHYGLSINHLPKLRSEGINIPLNFKNGEEKSIILYINDQGWPINDSYNIKTKKELEDQFIFEKKIHTISRSITGILLFIGVLLGIYLKKKVFLYYLICSLSAFTFFETEYGFILDLVPTNTPIREIQLINVYVYHNIFYFFYYLLIFNNKGLNRNIDKMMKGFVLFGLINIPIIYYYPYNLPILNRVLLTIAFTNCIISYFIVFHLLLKGISFKKFIAKSTFIIYLVTTIFSMIYSVLPNIGILQKTETSRYIFYIIYTFDIAYYLFIILYKYYQLIQERKELLLKYNDLQKGYSLALLEGQETEKNRIGRELHDYIGGNLALIDKMGSIFNPKSKNILDETMQSIDDITKGLDSKKHKPEAFHQLLQELFDKYESEEFQLHITFHDSLNSSPYIQNQFYRITQELLHNASKHSSAKNVYIDYYHNPDNHSSNLFYMDDGVGLKQKEDSDGIGLNNMKFRIEKLGGQMVIEEPIKGTKISFIGAKNIVGHKQIN